MFVDLFFPIDSAKQEQLMRKLRAYGSFLSIFGNRVLFMPLTCRLFFAGVDGSREKSTGADEQKLTTGLTI